MALISQEDELKRLAAQGDLPDTIETPFRPEEPKDTTKEFSQVDIASAAFQRENVISSAANRFRSENEVEDPNFNPYMEDEVRNNIAYASRPEAFTDDRNLEMMRTTMANIDREQFNQEVLAQSGWSGTAWSVVAGLTDLTTLIPGGPAVKAVSVAGRVGKGFAIGGATGVGALAASEAGLQTTQVTRAAEESAINIVAGGLLGGMLGGTISGLTKGQTAAAEMYVENVLRGNNGIDIKVATDGTYVPGDRSAGAAEAQTKQDFAFAHLNENVVKSINTASIYGTPLMRGTLAKHKTTREITEGLLETNLRREKNTLNIPSETAVESFIKGRTAENTIFNTQLKNDYLKFVGRNNEFTAAASSLRGKHMSYNAYSGQIGRAMRRNDIHKIPEVQKAARDIRAQRNATIREMQDVKLWDDELTDIGGASYFTRAFDNDVIANDVPKFKMALQNHFEKTTDWDEFKISDKVENAYNNIMGIGDDALEMSNMARSMLSTKSADFMKKRVLTINDVDFEEWLIDDAIGIHNAFMNKANAMIEMKKYMDSKGWDSIADINKQLRDENAVLVAKGEATVKDLKKEIDHVKNTFASVLGEIDETGVLGPKVDDALSTVRKFNVTTLLGNIGLTQLIDIGMFPFKNAGGFVRDAMSPWIRNPAMAKMARDELKAFGVGLELESNAMLRAIVDGEQSLGRVKTATGRAIDMGMDIFGRVSFMSYQNNIGKRIAGQMSSAGFIRSALKVAKGKKLPKVEQERLLSFNLTEKDMLKIAAEFEEHGQTANGSFIGNYHKWADKDLARRLGAAIGNDVDSTIITPGKADIPFAVQKSQALKSATQFQSFNMAATNKVLLSGLQRRDKNVLAGVMTLLSLGYARYAVSEYLNGREPKFDLFTFFSESTSRSGVGGLITQHAFNYLPGFKGSSRYTHTNVLEALVGPTGSQGAKALTLLKELTDGDISEKDVNKMIRLLPMQNLFYLRVLIKEAFGEENKRKAKGK